MKKAWCVALLLFVLISETLCFGLRIIEPVRHLRELGGMPEPVEQPVPRRDAFLRALVEAPDFCQDNKIVEYGHSPVRFSAKV